MTSAAYYIMRVKQVWAHPPWERSYVGWILLGWPEHTELGRPRWAPTREDTR
jgi:hypothetical protein